MPFLNIFLFLNSQSSVGWFDFLLIADWFVSVDVAVCKCSFADISAASQRCQMSGSEFQSLWLHFLRIL